MLRTTLLGVSVISLAVALVSPQRVDASERKWTGTPQYNPDTGVYTHDSCEGACEKDGRCCIWPAEE